jgi:phage terminase large subunit-like protein
MKPGKESLEALLALPAEEVEEVVRELGADAALRFFADWPAWVHPGQEPPDAEDWLTCLMLGGRGYGKTRAGAEWVSQMAREHPGAQIALVAANIDEARRVMIEGRSGLLAVARPGAEREHVRDRGLRDRPGRERLCARRPQRLGGCRPRAGR